MLPLAFLPNNCVLDILFRFGGLLALDAVLADGLCRFVRAAFGEMLCARIALSKLRHPGDGVYLLTEEAPDVPASREAWCVARPWISDRASVVAAMRHMPPCDFYVNEWLDRSMLVVARTPEQWAEFAAQCVEDQRFTDEWHALNGPCMHTQLFRRAEAEVEGLGAALRARETERILATKVRPRLSFAEEQAARLGAEQQADMLVRTLAEAHGLLMDLPIDAFDSQFPRVAHTVAGLAAEYPAVQWSLRLALYQAAEARLGHSAWTCERELWRRAWAGGHPMQALRRFLINN